ncbi:MAG: DUF1292 domain-containing protein, partial [Bacillota bacterium]
MRDDFRDDLDNDGEECEVLILIDDDGNEHSFELIAELEMEGNNYVVVAPIDEDLDQEEDEEVEITILRAT